MNGWILALLFFGVGLFGAILAGGIKKKSAVFFLALLFGGAAYLCRYFESRVSFAGTLGIVWGCLVLLSAGTAVMWVIRCVYGAKSRKDARARRKGAESGRLTKAARRRLVSRALVIVPLCLALCTGGVMVYTSLGASSGSGVLDNTIATPSSIRKKTINILVCGIDNDQNDAAHQQNMTDVIIVANVDFENKTAALLQIPRDTYVGDATSTGKINAVYNNASSAQGGINALATQLNKMFALPMDNYVTITMEGFRKAVDEIGGVEVTLEQEMVFNLRDTNEVIVRTVTLPAGANVLDGEMADLFVRYRDYARADLDRMNVQRVFLAALMNKLTSLSATQLLSTVNAVYPYLDTDFSLADLADLAVRAKAFSAASVTAVRVPGEPVNNYGSRNQSVFTLHRDELAEMLNTYMRSHAEPVVADQLDVIEIQNTTDILDHSDTPLDDYIPA